MLHGVAWCCMVLHGVAWCCMVLHGVAWCCMVLHGVAWCCMVLHGVAECCMVLQSVAWCCRVLHGVFAFVSSPFRLKKTQFTPLLSAELAADHVKKPTFMLAKKFSRIFIRFFTSSLPFYVCYIICFLSQFFLDCRCSLLYF